MARVRPVYKFKFFKHDELADFSQCIHDAMDGNMLFSGVQSRMVPFQDTINTFRACILKWGVKGNRGSTADHVALKYARVVVQEEIRYLCNFVNVVAAGSESVILAAG